MKRILSLFLPVLFFLSAQGQTQRVINMPGFQQLGTPSTQTRINGVLYPQVGYAPALYTDTATANANSYLKNIPFAQMSTSSDGKNWYRNADATKWELLGVGSTLSNIGSGYRLAVPGTNNVKTLFGGYGILWDSTSNTNGLTAKADTATLFPAVRGTISTNYIDSLRRVGLNVQAQKNGQWTTQFTDSIGSGGGTSLLSGRVFYLTKWGCVSDASLALESSTFGTDNTSAIQAVLDSAQNGPIMVVVDGKFSATQLKVRSNTYILCLPGMGFIQRDDSDKPFVVNYNRDSVIVDSNIIIQGGIWNLNGWRGGVAQQIKETMEGWTVGFRFAGVKNIIFRDMQLLNQMSFGSFFSKFKNVVFENMSITTNSATTNTDGFKFLVGEQLFVKNVSGKTGDDLLSICSNDIFYPTFPAPNNGPGQEAYDPASVYGEIKNVYVDGVHCEGNFAVRVLTGSERVDNVTIKNVTAVNTTPQMIIDNYVQGWGSLYGSSTQYGNVGTLVLENINVNVFINLDADNIILDRINRSSGLGTSPITIDTGSTIMNLTVKNFYSRYTSGSAIASFIKKKGYVRNVNLENNKLHMTAAVLDAPLYENAGGKTAHLQINGLYTRNVRHPLKVSGGEIQDITAANVYHTYDSTVIDTTRAFVTIDSNYQIRSFTFSNYQGYKILSNNKLAGVRRGDAFEGLLPVGIPSYGLVAYYRMEETSGNLKDSSINGFDLTRTGATSTTGKLDNATLFTSASSEYLSRADHPLFSMDASTGWSLAGWFNITNNGTYQIMASKWNTTGNQREWELYWDQAEGAIKFIYSTDGTGVTASLSRSHTSGSWVFVCVTWNGATLSMSLDNGVATTAGVTSVYSGTADFRIGADNGSLYYNGKADEIGLWKRALSTNEIAYLYNAGSGRVIAQ